MCGIAGIVHFDQPPETRRPALERMLRRLLHRGPDSTGLLESAHATLGNTRLSFLDRQNGRQPMSRGKWHLTYNGEVYNWRELRRELEPTWPFRTHCDTEVVLASLATWGAAALPRLNGMFAFFLWNNERNEGIAARDRLGVKPFVYLTAPYRFAFASEAKALLEAQPHRPRASHRAVAEYLAAPIFSGVEHPMFEDLRHLPAGEWLHVDRHGVQRHTWWDWSVQTEADPDETRLTEAVRAELAGAVDRSLRCDHPAGVFLSGGLDSTALTALATRRAGPGMKTFSIRYQDQAAFDYERSLIVRSDDTPFALEAARVLKTNHAEVVVNRAATDDSLRRIAEINDTLPAWEQELSQHHLAQTTHAAGVRCVLVGDAADETHYGYPFLLDEQATKDPRRILERFSAAQFLLDGETQFDRLAADYRALAEQAGHGWTTPDARLHATTYLVVKRWLPRLLQNGDIHTMAFSLEARVPFADTGLLQLSQRIPPALALKNRVEKQLLREAVRGIVPERHRLRPKSALPKDQATVRIYQAEAARAIEAERAFLGHWLDLSALSALLHPERSLSESERALLFRVICLRHWREVFNVAFP